MKRSEFLAAMGGAALGAQQPPVNPEDDRNRIVLDVARVNMLYTVSDKKGRFVTDLRQDDFQIIEGNKLQKVLEFAKESDSRTYSPESTSFLDRVKEVFTDAAE